MAAKEEILAVLRHRATHFLNFQYDGVRVYPGGYKRIADLIARDVIRLRLHPNQAVAMRLAGMGVGVYQHPTNTFLLPYPAFPADDYDRALVIHEMTHALMDWHAVPVNTLVSECVAYIAQMMWVQVKSNAQTANDLQRVVNHFVALIPRRDVRDVLTTAWEVARLARQPQGGYLVPPGPVIDHLRLCITQLPIYGHAGSQTSAYDGM